MDTAPDFVAGGVRVLKLMDMVSRVHWLASRPPCPEEDLRDRLDGIEKELDAIEELLPVCQEYTEQHGTAFAPHDPDFPSAPKLIVANVLHWLRYVRVGDPFRHPKYNGSMLGRLARCEFDPNAGRWCQNVREELSDWLDREYDRPSRCQAILDAAANAAGFHDHRIGFGGLATSSGRLAVPPTPEEDRRNNSKPQKNRSGRAIRRTRQYGRMRS